jgi:RNA polymerase sigma-70 factor (ECF subfamily)
MLKYRGTFRGGRFVTWMYHIARNVSADHFRKSRREMNVAEIGGSWLAEVANQNRRDAWREREGDSLLLERALLLLSLEKRELIVLARYRQMPYREIAELYGVDVGTVKVRVHRAVQELRDIFSKLADGGRSCNAKASESILPTT